MLEISALRRSYSLQSLDESSIAVSPYEQFKVWFRQAVEGQITEPNAMTLATVSSAGRPTARIVLLKGFDERGFVFFTNYDSKKGQEMAQNPFAALLFCWLDLERQVRIEGPVEKISPEESLAYFITRPKESQIGAWTSPQSAVIPGRHILEEKQAALTNQYAGSETLPLPPNWGGYILKPDYFEFWQGRESRLHDRIAYTPAGNEWHTARLAP